MLKFSCVQEGASPIFLSTTQYAFGSDKELKSDAKGLPMALLSFLLEPDIILRQRRPIFWRPRRAPLVNPSSSQD
jgi:hypothetical protein